MESCWAGQQCQRPLLGSVEPILQSIKLRYELGKSVMPDRVSRKKRPARMTSWPNQQEELKLENFPSPEPVTNADPMLGTEKVAPVEIPHSAPPDIPHQENPISQQFLEPIGNGLVSDITDIDRTVYANRDQIDVTNVFVEPSRSCRPEEDPEIFECISPEEQELARNMTNGDNHDSQAQFPISLPFLCSNR